MTLLPPIEPPAHLKDRILTRVAVARRRAARIRFALLAGGAFISGVTLALTALYAAQELYVSGFYDYVSLMFSDAAALRYSQEIALSLVEALPSASLLIFCGVGAVFVSLLARSIRSARTAFRTTLSYGSI